MQNARAATAAMVTAGAVVVALLGAACSAPAGRRPFPTASSTSQASSAAPLAGHALSAVSLAPGVVWAGLTYQATLVVESDHPVTVENISVGVQDDSGTRYDFPGTHPASVDGRYVFTSLARSFSPGSYTEFGTYEIQNVWYQLPAQTLRVLSGPTLRVPNPGPVGIQGRWVSTFNAGPGYRGGGVMDTVSQLLTWNGASGAPQMPNNSYENACYSATNVERQGSLIGLSLTRPVSSDCRPPAGWDAEPFYGAQISTLPSQDIKPGAAVEAEIYLPPAANGTIADWPAFWLYGPNWPTTGEIDVMEGLAGQGCYHFHWGTQQHVGNIGKCPSLGPGWHIFGLDWQPATHSDATAKAGADVSYRMTFYYDGRDVGTIVQGGVVKEPMALLLDITDNVLNPDLLPATMQVAYVRAWSGS